METFIEIADVVRNLSFKQKEKGLSTGEKKMLNNAKQILVSELVLSRTCITRRSRRTSRKQNKYILHDV